MVEKRAIVKLFLQAEGSGTAADTFVALVIIGWNVYKLDRSGRIFYPSSYRPGRMFDSPLCYNVCTSSLSWKLA